MGGVREGRRRRGFGEVTPPPPPREKPAVGSGGVGWCDGVMKAHAPITILACGDLYTWHACEIVTCFYYASIFRTLFD